MSAKLDRTAIRREKSWLPEAISQAIEHVEFREAEIRRHQALLERAKNDLEKLRKRASELGMKL